MKSSISFILLVVTIILFITIILGTIILIPKEIKKNNSTTIEQEICDHDYVVSSKYDYIFESYKTISKCSKCGKEIY